MLILGIVACFVGGGVSAVLAVGKGRSAFAWFLLGALFPVLGIVLLILQPALDPRGAPILQVRTADSFDQIRAKYAAIHAARQPASEPIAQQLAELTDDYEMKKAALLAQLGRT